MKKFIFSAAILAAILTSCGTSVTSRVADSKILGAAMSIQSYNSADLKVSDKREVFEYTVVTSRDGGNYKSNATYEFLEKFGADVIVEPRYEISYTNGVASKVKISGRPATLTNIAQLPAPAPTVCCKK